MGDSIVSAVERPHFHSSTAQLRELAGSDGDAVRAELAHRKSRAARKLASELGCATRAAAGKSRGKRPPKAIVTPQVSAGAAGATPLGVKAKAAPSTTYRVLKVRESRCQKQFRCLACDTLAEIGEGRITVTVTGPDGLYSEAYCSGPQCEPRWAVEGATFDSAPSLDEYAEHLSRSAADDLDVVEY